MGYMMLEVEFYLCLGQVCMVQMKLGIKIIGIGGGGSKTECYLCGDE